MFTHVVCTRTIPAPWHSDSTLALGIQVAQCRYYLHASGPKVSIVCRLGSQGWGMISGPFWAAVKGVGSKLAVVFAQAGSLTAVQNDSGLLLSNLI